MTTRRNIIAPEDWWAAFEKAAQSKGQTLSEWMRDACAATLPASVQKKLSEPRGVGKPRKPQ